MGARGESQKRANEHWGPLTKLREFAGRKETREGSKENKVVGKCSPNLHEIGKLPAWSWWILQGKDGVY